VGPLSPGPACSSKDGALSPDVADSVATVLAHCCTNTHEQQVLTSAGAVYGLCVLLVSKRRPSQVAALAALSPLLCGNPEACLELVRPGHLSRAHSKVTSEAASTPGIPPSHPTSSTTVPPEHPHNAPSCSTSTLGPDTQTTAPSSAAAAQNSTKSAAAAAEVMSALNSPSDSWPALEALLGLLRDQSPEVRLLAASCITHLAASFPRSTAAAAMLGSHRPPSNCSSSGGGGVPGPLVMRLEDARRAALPVLLRLLGDPVWAQAVPMVLSTLIENSEELQKAATDADAVRALAAILTQPSADACVREGALRALGSLCMSRDEVRRQLIDAKVLKHIIQGLEDPADGVRGAGALCVMALSRSVKTLRSSLLDTDVAQALCKLLTDSNPDVQVNAAAAVCNLVLEFNAVKSSVLSLGALEHLTSLACSMSAPLRLHSCWALRNLAYKSEAHVRRALMQGLPWPAMRSLLSDPEEGVQEQAICTLRNLCMDAPEHITAAFEWAGPDLLAAMEEKLDPSRDANPKLRQHALYTVVNILTGSESHKEAVATSNLPTLLLHHMRTSSNPDVRLPAVWCVINMTWPDANSAAGVAARAQRLKELGAEDVLSVLQTDASLDMRERVKTALEQMRAALTRPTGTPGVPS